MSDDINTSDDVTILPADYSLLRKLGGVSLESILTPEAIRHAEAAIAESAGAFRAECVDEAAKLRTLVVGLKKGGDGAAAGLERIAAGSFAIKTKAAQGGLELVSTLAGSLQNVCEKIKRSELTPPVLKIIEWHIQSLTKMLTLNVRGDGGQVGKAILAEMGKLPV